MYFIFITAFTSGAVLQNSWAQLGELMFKNSLYVNMSHEYVYSLLTYCFKFCRLLDFFPHYTLISSSLFDRLRTMTKICLCWWLHTFIYRNREPLCFSCIFYILTEISIETNSSVAGQKVIGVRCPGENAKHRFRQRHSTAHSWGSRDIPEGNCLSVQQIRSVPGC